MKDNEDKLSHYFLSRLYQEWKKLKPEEYSFDAFKECFKKARGHAGGKAKANKKMTTTNELFFIEERKFAEGQTGWMIGFFLNPDTAAKLAIPGGEAVEDLHVTLCFLGDVSMYDRLAISRGLVEFERFFKWLEPLTGEVSGLGRFQSSDGVDVIYASVDVPGLDELRSGLVRSLSNVGIKVSTEHGFDPHITLAYISSDAPTPEWNVGEIPLRFDKATSAFGDERIEVEIKGGWYMYHEGYKTVDIVDLAGKQHGTTRLFNELKQFAEPPDWIPYLPVPGKYTSPVYGAIIITRERNERFADNFNCAVYQETLPVDCEHQTKLSGACAWIMEMRVNDDGSVDALVEWTERGISLMEDDRFKYFSPEWFEEWSDPVSGEVYKDIAIGGALTTRPFFKEKALRPLIANEQGLFEVDGEVIDDSHNINFSTTALIPITAEKVVKTQTRGTNTMSEEKKEPTEVGTKPTIPVVDASPVTAQQFAELQTQLTEATAAAEANKQAAEAAQEEAKKASERIAALELAARTKRFNETAKDFVGETAKHVSLMEKMATAFGEDSEEFKSYVEQQTAAATQIRESELFKEKGRSGVQSADSATAMAEAKAKALMEKDINLSKSDALSQIFSDDPKLYERYTKESSVRASVAGGE